jgi:Big-like domain-containing protein/calcineurin-like phosphoesterase family protein
MEDLMLTKLCRTALVAGVALGCNDMASSPDRSSPANAGDMPSALSARSVSVQPSSATLDVGGTVQLRATAKPKKITSFEWSSSNASVATVSSTGLVTGVSAGTATITAVSGSASGTATITIRATTIPVASVTVTPNPASVGVGATVQLTATLKDANGNVLTGRPVTWTTNAAVATVSSSGLVRGVAAGTATITATSENKSGTSTVTVTSAPPSGSAVLLAAGDIASCSSSGDEATATLLDGLAGTVATLGDNAYEDGTTVEFSNCYNPTWGRHKARTRPSPGNHDYHTSGAAGYYGYFGASAGPSGRGYYSYDLGDWHIISLNSNVSMSAGSAQEQWLRADLAANPKACTLAYWHHPRFSSGTNHGNFSGAQPIWQALYDLNADVVLSGHEHNYERFAPQTPTGAADAARGIREFVVGTGGASHYSGHSAIPNSQVFNGATFGVLKLALGATSYTWQFVPVAGQSFSDSGSAPCH